MNDLELETRTQLLEIKVAELTEHLLSLVRTFDAYAARCDSDIEQLGKVIEFLMKDYRARESARIDEIFEHVKRYQKYPM